MVWPDEGLAIGAVDDDFVPVVDCLRRPAGSKHGGDVESPNQDCHMAGPASAIEADAQDVRLVHRKKLAGHQDVGNKNHILAQVFHPSLALALDRIDQVQRYILEIHSTLTKQVVIRLLKKRHHARGN